MLKGNVLVVLALYEHLYLFGKKIDEHILMCSITNMFWRAWTLSQVVTKCKKFYTRALLILSAALFVSGCSDIEKEKSKPITVGILYSQTGSMAPYEKPIMEATLLAIDELNAKGGVLNRQIEVIIADGASSPEVFAKEAEQLAQKQNMSAIMGCSTSYNRRHVSVVAEKHKNLLISPGPNEGIQLSSNVVYTGSAPNQLVVPGISWAFKHLGKKFYLVGSDEVYSRVSNEIIKDYVYALGGEIVGESYLPLFEKNQMESVIEAVELSQPDVIANTLVGEANLDFYGALRGAGIYSEDIPVINFSFSENLLRQLGPSSLEGDYNVAAYFQDIKNTQNDHFVEAFQQKYGKGRAIDDSMEAAYVGVYLWAEAVESAGKSRPEEVLNEIRAKSYIAPSGLTYVSPSTKMNYKPVRLGKIKADGNYDIIWDSKVSIFPVAYTIFKSQQAWDDFLQDLYQKWGHKWYRKNRQA